MKRVLPFIIMGLILALLLGACGRQPSTSRQEPASAPRRTATRTREPAEDTTRPTRTPRIVIATREGEAAEPTRTPRIVLVDRTETTEPPADEGTPPPLPTPTTAQETPPPLPTPTAAETAVVAESPTPAETPPADDGAESRVAFGVFEEPTVEVVPNVQHEPIAADLGNVRVPFVLSPEQLDRLAANGFVVSPGQELEFFTVYEQARYSNVPVFVTSDSLLHVYHLLFDKTLRSAETQYFIPMLQALNAALLRSAEEQYEALRGGEWEEAALRTLAFVGVGAKLADPEAETPAAAASLVNAELVLIEEAAGIQPSPLFPGLEFGEDYSQYIPRGHYTRSAALESYFRAMMWYGRMTFRLTTEDPEVGRAETRSALLLVHALGDTEVEGRPALEVWADLYDPTVFFVGRSDDLTVLQYAGLMDEIYGPDAGVEQIADEARLDTFIEQANRLPPPRILGLVISEQDEVESTTKGLRFMGQRFVPDAFIFRQLIYRNVGTPDQPRLLPKGLDIMAALGSERAYEILDQLGETRYANYPEQMEEVRGWVGGLSVAEWTETLYNTWLYSFLPLLEPPGEGYPAFMQSPAWVDKQLNTVLGSWAELKHDTILYAKQVYAEAGAGPPPPEPIPPRGYVEPVPHFYARLAALTAMTREGLSSRGLLGEADDASLAQLEELVRAFQAMAEKELSGQPLTEEEYGRIRFYGRELESLTMAAADTEEEQDPFAERQMDEPPQAAVVADVATDPNGQVLEEAVGRINEIHVVVPVVEDDGTVALQVAKGGVFSYYEFAWPLDDRLTDERWREMLDAGEAPALPEWTQSFFTAAGEYSDLTQAVSTFQEALTAAYWYGSASPAVMAGDALDLVSADVDAYLAEGQYVGRQLAATDFRSFDRQSEEVAIVTVRETWVDRLYEGSPGDFGDPIAERGPYTLDVTYTLEPGQYGWIVTNIVYADEPPGWE